MSVCRGGGSQIEARRIAAGRSPPLPPAAHLHRDVALADGEELKARGHALLGLGEAVDLDREVVALGVPVDLGLCEVKV